MRHRNRLTRKLSFALSLVMLLLCAAGSWAEATAPEGFEAVKMQVLPNGETLAYREQGQGEKTLLLIHGNMSSSLFFDVLAARLPLEDYRVLALDLRGFGDSSYQTPVATIKDFSDDVKAFADALGLEDFVLGGWSLGGIIALQYAADYPEDVAKLVLIASTTKAIAFPKMDAQGGVIPGEFYSTRDEIAMLNAANLATLENKDYTSMQMGLNFVIYNANQPDEARYQRYLDEIFKQRNLVDATYAIALFNISNTHNGLTEGTGEVDKILCPVLVIQGEYDMLVPAAYGSIVASEIGENAQLVMLPSGHSPLEDSLDPMMEALLSFLED